MKYDLFSRHHFSFARFSVCKTACLVSLSILSTSCSLDTSEPNELGSEMLEQAIINGTDAPRDSAPWMAIIRTGGNQPGGHLCGGSLIDPTHVLTAAHCLLPRGYVQLPGFQVVLGAHRLSEIDTDSNVQIIRGRFVSVHPGFNMDTGAHDLAMVELESPATITPYVQPISLGSGGDTAGTSAKLNGWGKYTSESEKPDALLQGLLPIVPNATCDSVLQRPLDGSMLCAGIVPENVADRVVACHGDSGGPLAVHRNGNWELAGVVSWGQPAVCGTYSAYSRVSSQRDWIDWAQASQYRYLRCNNTEWNVSDSNRLRQDPTLNSFSIEFNVTQLNDSCTITYTNELNGWGTKNGDFRLTSQGEDESALASGKLTYEQNLPTHFSVQYTHPGRYRLELPSPLIVEFQHRYRIVEVGPN